jgi:hypothetical protein
MNYDNLLVLVHARTTSCAIAPLTSDKNIVRHNHEMRQKSPFHLHRKIITAKWFWILESGLWIDRPNPWLDVLHLGSAENIRVRTSVPHRSRSLTICTNDSRKAAKPAMPRPPISPPHLSTTNPFSLPRAHAPPIPSRFP